MHIWLLTADGSDGCDRATDYQFGKIVELRKLPENILAGYLESGFRNSGIGFTAGIAGRIIEICEGIPHYVQYLGSGAWEEAIENRLKLDDDVLQRAVMKILINQSDYFAAQYERLTLHRQCRGLLRGCLMMAY